MPRAIAPASENKLADTPETVTEFVEASIKGEDEPMESHHPVATGALVWLSYPLALIVLLLLAFVAIAVFR